MKLNLPYSLGDKVAVPELGRTGKITSIYIDGDGPAYRVRYFDNAAPQQVYFTADELKPIGPSLPSPTSQPSREP